MAVSKLAPIATKVIYEDEYVRVWNQVVPAGGQIKKHAHRNDYFLLNVTGNGPIEVDFHEGTGADLPSGLVAQTSRPLSPRIGAVHRPPF